MDNDKFVFTIQKISNGFKLTRNEGLQGEWYFKTISELTNHIASFLKPKTTRIRKKGAIKAANTAHSASNGLSNAELA